MNPSKKDPKPAQATDGTQPNAPELTRDGLGLPHLAHVPGAHDSSLEPDGAPDLDETVRKDKEVADENAARKRKS